MDSEKCPNCGEWLRLETMTDGAEGEFREFIIAAECGECDYEWEDPHLAGKGWWPEEKFGEERGL